MLLSKYYKNFCDKRQIINKYRILPVSEISGNKQFIDFSSNDYLGLAKSEKLKVAGIKALNQSGVGATGSRLLSGNSLLLTGFEIEIARTKKTETSLILNSGFQANSSVLASLLNKQVLGAKPLVFFDKFNHASLYQGVFLSGAQLIRYRHCDWQHLNWLLQKYNKYSVPKFIVTETVFGMDGDCAAIEIIADMARKYKAFLYLDEAHATGLYGPLGYGLANNVDLSANEVLIMGTFSKGLGCFGAYVGCSEIVKNYLINNCPGFIYSTALPPSLVGIMQASWQSIPLMDAKRLKLKKLSKNCKTKLQDFGLDVGRSTTNIIPILFKDSELVMRAKKILYDQGVIVSAIRPPTVPPKTARLRIALCANHDEKDVKSLLQALAKI